MSSRVFKNYQVNLGIPFEIKVPVIEKRIEISNDDNENIEGHRLAMEREANEILSRARDEAETIIQEAEAACTYMHEEAERQSNQKCLILEEEARKTGFERGYKEAQAKCEAILDELHAIREQARNEYTKVMAAAENDIVTLVLDIAEKVLEREISSNYSEGIVSLVRDAVSRCTSREKVILKVSSDDYEIVEASKEKLRAAEGIEEFEVRKDGSLSRGACLVETPYGIIDAGISTKMKKVKEIFENASEVAGTP